jgi:hypothetical protein
VGGAVGGQGDQWTHLGAVGREFAINVEVLGCLDDGFEWWGGTVEPLSRGAFAGTISST